MQNYKMKIAYDGRRYKSFNIQKGDVEKGVQGKLQQILEKLFERNIEVIGAVNTDAGVHAKGQIVNFKATDDSKSEKEILEYLEKFLTDDIIVLSVEKADERFQSRFAVRRATYEYRLWKNNATVRPLFERDYVNVMKQNLNVSKMKKAAEDFIGEHDFLAFTTNKKAKKSVKEMVSLNVEETQNEIIITMTANGFLLNMERLIVGTLIQVGLGQLPMGAVNKAFDSKDMKDVGHKASAGALCLMNVDF